MKTRSLRRYIAGHRKPTRVDKRTFRFYVSGSGKPIDKPFDIDELHSFAQPAVAPNDWILSLIQRFNWRQL